MRGVKYVVLLACILTGEAALAPALRQPPATGCNAPEPNATTILISTLSLITNGTTTGVPIFFPSAQEPSFKHHKDVMARRKLGGGFRECSPCTCCDSTRRSCLPTVCCYQIDCGIRDLPFGICSFTPISCSCLGCRD